jgi:outer membrane lipoprotein-sorting protein
MKKKFFISFAVAFAAVSFIYAQDLDRILENHFDAIGQENIVNVKTIKATGKAMNMGMEMPFTMMNKRPNMIRIVVEFQGSQIIQATDGKTVWMANPMMGSAEPVEITGEQAGGLIESADMDGQLWNYEEKGHRLELDGTEEVDGSETYVLKLIKESGNTDYYYLDKDNYRVVKVRSTAIMNGSEVETETFLSDYRVVEGYMMPFVTEQRFNGQQANRIIIEEVTFNEKMDDDIFSMPD